YVTRHLPLPTLFPYTTLFRSGCLLVVVTHACTVLIYFVEKDLTDRVFPGFQEKFLTMAERLVLALCFLVPGHLWPIASLVWLSLDRKSTRLNSSHVKISYAVF